MANNPQQGLCPNNCQAVNDSWLTSTQMHSVTVPHNAVPASLVACQDVLAVRFVVLCWYELFGPTLPIILSFLLFPFSTWRRAILEDDQLLRQLLFQMDVSRPFKGQKTPMQLQRLPAALTQQLRRMTASGQHPALLMRVSGGGFSSTDTEEASRTIVCKYVLR